MTRLSVTIVTALTALSLAACSSLPDRVDQLEQARTIVSEVNDNPRAGQIAGGEIDEAERALERAESAFQNNGDLAVIKHESYVAIRHAQIASERIAEAEAREAIEDSEAERAKVIVGARAREAQRARELAATLASKAEQNARSAETQKNRADAAMATARALSEELEELKAEKTARGLVLTLSDILFDTDESQLKPGAENALNRLAGFMQNYPEYRLLIEGHTDSRGPDAYNRSLSQRRADAVLSALIERGVPRNRLLSRGMGEAHPVASNQTIAGRQENRRVEIVLSDDDGSFPSAANRTASTR